MKNQGRSNIFQNLNCATALNGGVFFMKIKALILTALIVTLVAFGFAGKLVINSYNGDPEPRRVTNLLLEMFNEQYPDIEVELNIFAHEDFKTLIRTWLPSDDAPDVAQWFAGERMRYFADKGLLESMDDILGGEKWNEFFPEAFRSACSYDGEVYFLPESWYWWGVYYRPSIFAEVGIEVPETWDEFVAACEALKVAGYNPITIGTKYLWTAAAWFDLLNMRVNGLDKYIEVLDGKVPYNSDEIKETMEYWAVLVENGYFNDDASALTWQEALQRMITGDSAMYLMGQFIADSFPDDLEDDLDFFRFPVIKEDMGLYEETPIDGWMLPKNGKNKEEAKIWMEFISSKEVQSFIASELGRLAANKDVPAPNAHAQKGLDMIMESDGVIGFYDRDTNPEMANKGMNGFVQFMMYPEMLDQILDSLENDRKRIYE